MNVIDQSNATSEEILYCLDAETLSAEYRVTTFSYNLGDLITDFSAWMTDKEITFSDISYATILRCEDLEPVADLVYDDTGTVALQPRQPNNSLLHRLVLWFRKHL